MRVSAVPSGPTRNAVARTPAASAATANSGDTPPGTAMISPPGRSNITRVLSLNPAGTSP
jgi:hypothetical protein